MMIAVIGVLAGVLVGYMYDDTSAIHRAKIESDVSTLNQMVGIYLADGGDLTGVTNAQAVLDKLKRTRTQADSRQHTGSASGRLLDPRMSVRMSSTLQDNRQVRAYWDSTKKRFALTQASSGSAINEFYLEESLAAKNYGTEPRRSMGIKYNGTNQGWVWTGAGTSPAPTAVEPTSFDTSGTNPASGFNPEESAPTTGPTTSTGSGGSGSGSGGTPPSVLPVPLITPAGAVFKYSEFPSSVTITSNGATAAVSKLIVDTGSGWTDFSSGGTFGPFASGQLIRAKNETLDSSLWVSSAQTEQRYYRLVQNFAGGGTTSWGNPTGGSNMIAPAAENGDPTSTFRHGNTRLDLGNGEFLDAGVQNVLSFTRSDFSAIEPNKWFKFGSMSMLNGTTFYDSEAAGVTLTTQLNLSAPLAQSVVAHINLGLVSTDNSSDRLASADIVEFRNATTDASVTIDGVKYTLELTWATLDPGAGVVQGNQFLIFEGSTARAEIRARFKSTPIIN
ncbi:MAG: choice-of-anchor K domain-containing protein [Verrucomicrobiaceae bacterium]|nr:choice-of-anchor K domain-containing protein [Verrucomicrobiaceae bacterium]